MLSFDPRRWLRISLRGTFVLLTLLCIWLGTYVQRVYHQRNAVEWIDQQHGRIWYDYQLDGHIRNLDAPPPGPEWIRERLGIDFVATPRIVSVRALEGGIEPLAGLPKLQELVLERTGVRDLRPLSRLRYLKKLYLGYTPVEDITPLLSLTQLTHLSLNNTRVSDAATLAKLASLESLSLHNARVSSEDFTMLRARLPKCKIIWSSRDEP